MKRLMVSSFWKIVKQSPRSLFRNWIQEHGQTINYEQPVKKVITLYCFYSSEKKQKTFWQQLNKFSFGNLTGTQTTTRFCQCLRNVLEWFSLELNIVVMLFLVKKTKSLKKTGGSFITNKHVNGHLFQAVTLQLSEIELLHRYNGRYISKFLGKVFTKFI